MSYILSSSGSNSNNVQFSIQGDFEHNTVPLNRWGSCIGVFYLVISIFSFNRSISLEQMGKLHRWLRWPENNNNTGTMDREECERKVKELEWERNQVFSMEFITFYQSPTQPDSGLTDF